MGAPDDLIRFAWTEGWTFADLLKRLDDGLDEHKRDCPIDFYEPYPHQRKFHAMKSRIGGIIGANQCGKTTACVTDVIARCRKRYWTKHYDHPPKFYYCFPSNKVFKEVHIPEFLKWLPRKEVKKWGESPDSKTENPLIFDGGAQVSFMSYEIKDVYKWGGAVLDGVYNDEEPLQFQYFEQRMRTLRYGGFIRFALTPVEGTMWLYDLIKSDEFELITAKTEDNLVIPKEQIEARKQEFMEPDGTLSTEGLIRLMGHYILRAGQSVFSTIALERQLERIRESGLVPQNLFISELATQQPALTRR